MNAKPLLLAAIVAGAFLAGFWYKGRRSSDVASAAGSSILRYVCPMHPQYVSDRPGAAPCCGMRLEPIYERGAGAAGAGNRTVGVPPGAVEVSLGRQQLIGVRVAPVEKWAGTHTIRTTGRVAADETRVYRLNASTECWVRKVYGATTGSAVQKDEPLLAFYATNFLTAASSYLYALDTQDRRKAAKGEAPEQLAVTNVQVRQAVESLQNLGVSDIQIEEMASERRVSDLVTVRSPANGLVLSRNVSLGQWIGPGTEMYQIADLSRVWVLADLFGDEARYVQPGLAVRVALPDQKTTFAARVSHVPPLFDSIARTLKVRLEMDNPGYMLRPDMFVDVEFPIRVRAALAVPADAVLDSGRVKTVFLDRGKGLFEPREIQTGWRFGDRVEIVEGLEAGDRIVVAGNFLLDSESRMKLAAQRGARPREGGSAIRPESAVTDPVCGMRLELDKAAARSEHQGRSYYFCAKGCKGEFDRDPAAFAETPAGGGLQH